jgi:serine/threonine protein kinase
MTENLVGEKLGNYRLERLLGRGRMGVVYLARDEALLRPTAVKILSWSIPESIGQNPEAWFIAEARNVARVNHPHVVQIYGVARHGAHCYIAMEYIDGTTADAWITQDGPFTVDLATELLIQTAAALQAAHDANVVHRDVKPENLLLGSDGKAKLGDFGMALHTGRTRVTDANRAGTPYYTAPEIWRGSVASVSTDIYALGATYYYLLTGRPPFVANDLQALVAAHLHSPIPEIVSPKGIIPPGCQEIVRRCMAKTPPQRFPSAQAVGWEARAQLRRLASVPPPSISTQGFSSQLQEIQVTTTNTVSYVSSGTKPALLSAAHWHSFFGFIREPFTQYEIGRAPYQGEPFLSLLPQLNDHIKEANGATVLLVGESGTGRTSLAQELLIRRAGYGPCSHVSCEGLGPKQTLTKKLLWALGVPTIAGSASRSDIDPLVEHCLVIRNSSGLPLIVLDDCEKNTNALNEIFAIALAAQQTNSFSLLLLGTAAFERRLTQSFASSERAHLELVPIRELNGLEVTNYVMGWITSTLAPGVAPILFTPDALLIVTHRSQGLPSRINQLIANMLQAAARLERRVLDSWDAWNAPLEPTESVREEERPVSWPTPEALEVLNQCRLQVGMQVRR